MEVARQLTYPERVTKYNLALMKQLVKNGPDIHPGALFVKARNTSGMKSLRYAHKEEVAAKLCMGDIIER